MSSETALAGGAKPALVRPRRAPSSARVALLGVFSPGSHGRVHCVQIGVVYPQIELGGDPTAVARLGRAVEELGFDYLLAYDHVLGAVHAGRTPRLTGPYTERDPFHDPFVMFAYLAGMTERIGFATGVLILPQRQTALVARQAADVELLSRRPTAPGGRGRLEPGGVRGLGSRLPQPRRPPGRADRAAAPIVHRTRCRLRRPLRPG